MGPGGQKLGRPTPFRAPRPLRHTVNCLFILYPCGVQYPVSASVALASCFLRGTRGLPGPPKPPIKKGLRPLPPPYNKRDFYKNAYKNGSKIRFLGCSGVGNM